MIKKNMPMPRKGYPNSMEADPPALCGAFLAAPAGADFAAAAVWRTRMASRRRVSAACSADFLLYSDRLRPQRGQMLVLLLKFLLQCGQIIMLRRGSSFNEVPEEHAEDAAEEAEDVRHRRVA